jgi:hypothetical protein
LIFFNFAQLQPQPGVLALETSTLQTEALVLTTNLPPLLVEALVFQKSGVAPTALCPGATPQPAALFSLALAAAPMVQLFLAEDHALIINLLLSHVVARVHHKSDHAAMEYYPALTRLPAAQSQLAHAVVQTDLALRLDPAKPTIFKVQWHVDRHASAKHEHALMVY